jgi:HAD superfamily hydrolase (TIGR01509 family)
MIKTILSDLSRVILFPKDKNYQGNVNQLYQQIKNSHPNFNFFDYFKIDGQILNFYTQLKNKYSLKMFTSGKVQEDQHLRVILEGLFEQIYSAQVYGLDKSLPEAYLFIAQKLGQPPDEILFIDDSAENIEAAKKAGMQTYHFKNTPDLIREINKILD